ncbi:RNA polymerase sigma factor [Sphingomonas parva]|uniref:RNA polymerase sigma factor n=1 Tax=Sphingomonas parva TaxID=2555898 RepID=UPI001CDCE2B2|nr:sigma-70 family RNA polymerase sigma factor [Sphingomonas parva]
MGAAERARDTGEGSPSGLEQVYLVHREALLRFLRARGAGDDAEDLLQEMWIKASAGVSGPIRDPVPYLYRTASNLMLDRRRAGLRQAKRDTEWAGVEPGVERPDDRPNAEQQAVARSELAQAEAVLTGLGERTDAIFRRFRLRGQNQREIAADLGISLSAVEKHLQKAYRALIDYRRRRDAD